MKDVLKQMTALLEQLRAQGALDLVGTTVGQSPIEFVLTMDRTFLGDPSFSELVDGEYTVLGKVTRVIARNSQDSINLLRKTSLGRMQDQLLTQLTTALEGMNEHGFSLPPIITEVRGPAIQVIPIAVFA